MSSGDPYELKPYRLEWRSDLTTSWVLIEQLAEHPGDLAEYVKTRKDSERHWARAGQWRCVTQHVISVSGLGAKHFPNKH